MMNLKRDGNAIVGGLVALCVLLALYLNTASSESALGLFLPRERAVSAMRYLPVYSYLGTAETNEVFLMDTTHGAEGYVAVTAKSEEPVKIRLIAPGGLERVYNVPHTGLVSYYPLSDGRGTYGIQLLKKADASEGENMYVQVLQGSCEAMLFDEFQPFLRPSSYVWFTGYSDCVAEAARICSGQSSDDRKIERIKDYICDNLSYDELLAESDDQSFIRDPDAILSRKSGTCLDYSVLAAAMLRSQGIPTKVVYGEMNGAQGLHAWNMVYTSSRGWFRLDLSSQDNGIAESYVADERNYTDSGWY